MPPPAALWRAVSAGLEVPAPPGVLPLEQLTWTLFHPLDLFLLLARTIATQAHSWANQMVGVLGWLDTPLPRPLVAAQLLLLPLAALLEPLERPLARSTRLLLAATLAGSTLALLLYAYVVWMPVGAGTIDGLQGRYFLPLAPMALALLAGAAPRLARDRAAPLLLAAQGLLLAWSVAVVVGRYWR